MRWRFIFTDVLQIIVDMFLPHVPLCELEEECFSKILPKVRFLTAHTPECVFLFPHDEGHVLLSPAYRWWRCLLACWTRLASTLEACLARTLSCKRSSGMFCRFSD